MYVTLSKNWYKIYLYICCIWITWILLKSKISTISYVFGISVSKLKAIIRLRTCTLQAFCLNKITLCLSCNGQRNWWLLSACVALHTWQTLTAALCPSVDETRDSVWDRTARLTTWTGNPQPPQPSICIVWRNPSS